MRHTPGPLDEQQVQLVERLRAARGAPVSFDELRAIGIENPALLCYELAAVGLPVTRTCAPGEGMPALSVRLEPDWDPRRSDAELSHSPETTDLQAASRPRLPPRPRYPPRPRHPPRPRVPPRPREAHPPRVLGWLASVPDRLRVRGMAVEAPAARALDALTNAPAKLRSLRKPLERAGGGSLEWLASAAAGLEPGVRRAGQAARHARPPALIAMAALALTLIAVVAIVLGNQSGNQATRVGSLGHSHHNAVPGRSGSGQAASVTPPAARASGPSAGLPSALTRTPISPADAEALEAQGHQLLAQGSYASAIQRLSAAIGASGQSLAGCTEPASEACLTFAYALYDLGRALRLEGHHVEAIAILSERLRIDNQRPTVQHELELARGARA
jgi:hypothetical protein